MADAKRCDICGTFYMTPFGFISNVGYQLVYISALAPSHTYDLCPDCSDKLNKFVESMKENNHD